MCTPSLQADFVSFRTRRHRLAAGGLALRSRLYRRLLAHGDGSRNAVWLAQILSSWLLGQGALPDALGLEQDAFRALLANRFPGCRLRQCAVSGKRADFSRMLERRDLEALLCRHAGRPGRESEWLAGILVAACLGNDHLWQDLGLWSRAELSAMLEHNFKELAERNSRDMKWKKFLYKQLCEAEGLYICRAPSCDVCKDYDQCFGREI